MSDDMTVEFYREIDDDIWLRVVRQGNTRHIFITCDTNQPSQLEAGVRVMVKKIGEGYTFQGIVPTSDNWHEFWLSTPADGADCGPQMHDRNSAP